MNILRAKFGKSVFLLVKPVVVVVRLTNPSGAVGVMITSSRKLSHVNSKVVQARQDVLAVDCKNSQLGKGGSTVVQLPSRRDDTACLLLDHQHIHTVGSVNPKVTLVVGPQPYT